VTRSIDPVERVLIVGDTRGVPRLLRHVTGRLVCGVVAAEIRPQYHSELEVIAADHKVPFLIQPRVTSPEYSGFVRSVTELAPDLLLCDSYSMLLRPDVLSVPRAGAVNVHGGLLPQYRGGNPLQWTIINDETQAGVTIHYMDEGFDSGSIIAQRQVPVMFTDTWRDVMSRIDATTDELLREQAPLILTGRAMATPQEPARARYYRHRRPLDGLIDWSQSVRAIYNLVRALVAPLPGAFYLRGAETVVAHEYMTIAQVAALKQEMIAGQWPNLASCAIRVNSDSSQERILLDVLDAGGDRIGSTELHAIDYEARTAMVRWFPVAPSLTGRPQALEAVLEFARTELGLSKFETSDS
jgi:methionyl-tRNA formyltransferase